MRDSGGTLTIGRPNGKQVAFFQARNRFIAYGGARGGGKSWAVRKKAQLMALKYAGIKLLVLRRTFPELRENHILPMMADLMGIAVYRESDKAFVFPNGSRLRFGYCDTDKDVLQYQGQEYDVIFLDEATQFTEYQFQTLTACIRGANDFPKRMYLTCNPGGVGHEWVKRLFIDRQYRRSERAEDYAFIPARVYDNHALMESDRGYVQMLENLPEDLRRAWLEGDWNVFEGQYFKEFREDVHVCEPIELPEHWRRYITLDYGLDMLACYWIAVDEQRNAWVYRELYQSGLIISEAAKAILERTGSEEIYATLAPPDLWNRRQETGKSVADIFWEYGIRLTKTSNDRISGWMAVKEWLKVEETSKQMGFAGTNCAKKQIHGEWNVSERERAGGGCRRNRAGEFISPSECNRGGPASFASGEKKPRLQIFRGCRNLIRTLPAVQYDDKKPNDVAREPHELTHAPDALRGFCVYWTQAAKGLPKPPPIYNFACERPKRAATGKGDKLVVI